MRSELIGVRVTPGERRLIERAAARETLPLSAWARRLLLATIRSERQAVRARTAGGGSAPQ